MYFTFLILQDEHDQQRLFSHCQSHAQELMCMKCFLTYDDKLEFRKHLYYKHEDEHKVCRSCHQKTWPHVYHFCGVKQSDLVCEVCESDFGTDFKRYRVHLRTHTGANPYLCSAQGCQKAYISRQLLWKHQIRRHPELAINASKLLQEKRNKRDLVKYGAKSIENVKFCEEIIDSLLMKVIPDEPEVMNEKEDSEKENTEIEANKENEEDVSLSTTSPPKDKKEDSESEKSPEEYDPIDAAVRSIMGPEGTIRMNRSPTKTPLSPSGSDFIRSPPNYHHPQTMANPSEPPQLIVKTMNPMSNVIRNPSIRPGVVRKKTQNLLKYIVNS